MLIRAILLTVVGYFVLMYVTVNLVGMVVRGFFRNPELEKLSEEGHLFIKKEVAKANRADNAITIVFAIVGLTFFYLLYHFINIWALLAALLFVIDRVPDLVWEIRHGGRKITKGYGPEGVFYTLTGLLNLAAVPVLFWAFYTL